MGKDWFPKRRKKAEAGCCMGSVFQLLFDFNHQQTLPNFYSIDETVSSAGVEAPRNSLDLEEEETLKFPMGIRIKRINEFSSEAGYDSPGAKTPNLVARLMGLDLLPDCGSPSMSSKSAGKFTGKMCFEYDIGVRSLPETPRVSSGRRSDAECHHHRLSLQITEFATPEKVSLRRGRIAGAAEKENLSKGKNEKQRLKHGKSRRFVGVDITNTVDIQREIWPDNISPAKRNPKTSSESDVILKPRKKNHQISCEEMNRNLRVINQKQNKISSRKCQRISPKLHQKNPKKKQDPIFISSSRDNPPRPNSKISSSQKQKLQSQFQSSERRTQLSSNTSRSYRSYKIYTAVPDIGNGSATAFPASTAAEYGDYIRRILQFSRFRNRIRLPINPLVFEKLELGAPAADGDRSNRKLIFHLVDEILVEHYKTRIDLKPGSTSLAAGDWRALVDELCKKIDSFPAKKCEVLEDVDSLINLDMRKMKINIFSDEKDCGIVGEIEGEILEHLVKETAAIIGRRT